MMQDCSSLTAGITLKSLLVVCGVGMPWRSLEPHCDGAAWMCPNHFDVKGQGDRESRRGNRGTEGRSHSGFQL